MMDPLSISNLMRLIRKHEFDAQIYRHCEEAERLSRRREFEQAIHLAHIAVETAVRTGDSRTIGITFLYLATIRHTSSSKADRERAPYDCATAIMWLRQDSHHLALAEVICARMMHDNDKSRIALGHYRQAGKLLDALRTESYRKDDSENEHLYQDLHRAVMATIERIEFPTQPAGPAFAAEATREGGAGASPESPEPEAYMHPLFVRTSEWPRVPVFTVSAGAGFPEGGFESHTEEFLEIEVDRVIIGGKRYALRQINGKTSSNDALRLRGDRRYGVILVDGDSMEPNIHRGAYLLVREQGYHEFDGQIIIAKIGVPNESDPVKNIVKRAQGYPKIRVLESDNPNKAMHPPIDPGAPDVQASVIGVVDAVLTRIDTGTAPL